VAQKIKGFFQAQQVPESMPKNPMQMADPALQAMKQRLAKKQKPMKLPMARPKTASNMVKKAI